MKIWNLHVSQMFFWISMNSGMKIGFVVSKHEYFVSFQKSDTEKSVLKLEQAGGYF